MKTVLSILALAFTTSAFADDHVSFPKGKVWRQMGTEVEAKDVSIAYDMEYNMYKVRVGDNTYDTMKVADKSLAGYRKLVMGFLQADAQRKETAMLWMGPLVSDQKTSIYQGSVHKILCHADWVDNCIVKATEQWDSGNKEGFEFWGMFHFHD
jgi:hypothetical protein